MKYSVRLALEFPLAFGRSRQTEKHTLRINRKKFFFPFTSVLPESNRVRDFRASRQKHRPLSVLVRNFLKMWLRTYGISGMTDLFSPPCFDYLAFLLIPHLQTNCEGLEWQARAPRNIEKVTAI